MTLPVYKYQVKDYSLLTPPFKKWIVTPLIRFLPWVIPANIVTILSNFCMYSALGLSFFHEPTQKWHFIVIPILILGYLIGDHLDGMQAKRTGTGSALGEFCDHFHDTFNNGILFMIMFFLFDIKNPITVSVIMGISYMVHACVFHEQLHTGWLIFEKLGSLEGVLIGICFILGGFFPITHSFLSQPQYLVYSGLEILLILSSLGSILTMFVTLWRTKKMSFSLFLFFISLGLTIFFGIKTLTFNYLCITITLFSSVYLGTLMRGHLIDKMERLPDLLVPVLLMIAFFSEKLSQNYLQLLIFSYLILQVIKIVYLVGSPLKRYWVWKNPIKEIKQ